MAVVPDHVTVMPAGVGKCSDAITVVDYACVRRCRQRRLATYLWLHGFGDTLRGLVNESDAFMSAAHLSRLVRQGLWVNAVLYLSRFLGPPSEPRSDEANVLIHFLRQHKAYASIVAGVDNRDLKSRQRRYIKEQDMPRAKTLTKIFLWTKKRIPSTTRSHKLNTN